MIDVYTLRHSKEALDLFQELSAKIHIPIPIGSGVVPRYVYYPASNSVNTLRRGYCSAQRYPLVTVKTLRMLVLMNDSEVRKAYLDSIKTKRK